MALSSLSLKVGIAEPADAKSIARLCRRAVGSGDYALRILKEVITDRGLFLAWSDGELVGMTNLDRSIDGSGWLSMARTDPKWRRKGVALFLQQYVGDYGRKRGLRALRLWTLSTNTPSIRACVKGGFKPVCEAAHVSSSIKRKRRAKFPSAIKRMGRDELLQSPYLRKMNGYFAYKWYFVEPSRELLGKLLRKGELHLNGESIFILTKPETGFRAPYCSFALLSGPATTSLGKVKKTAAGFGRVWLGGYLPYNAHLLKRAEEAGFRRDLWAKHCLVFEKMI